MKNKNHFFLSFLKKPEGDSMWFQILSLLFISLGTEAGEIHSLEYIYTALSKPVNLPGIYEFTAMGILDDKQIDYYNSEDKQKIPRQTWMRERLDRSYWEKGTQSRRSKEQWFKVNVNILMDRMRQNNSDIHVLQWRHGCRGEHQPDGKLRFLRGFDQYSYDGADFLSFDDANSRWIAPVTSAVPTKRKWDDSQTLNQYTKGYLQKECMDWLSKFMSYGEEELRKHLPPKVFAFAKKSKTPGKIMLHCLATGFYPKDVELNIYRNNNPLTERDGVMSTGVRPNGVNPDDPNQEVEETFQLKKSLEIPDSDDNEYRCTVNHRSLPEPVVKIWDRRCSDCSNGALTAIIAGAVVSVILLAAVSGIMFFLYKRGIIGKKDGKGSEIAIQSGSSSMSIPSEQTPEEAKKLIINEKQKKKALKKVSALIQATVQDQQAAVTALKWERSCWKMIQATIQNPQVAAAMRPVIPKFQCWAVTTMFNTSVLTCSLLFCLNTTTYRNQCVLSI